MNIGIISPNITKAKHLDEIYNVANNLEADNTYIVFASDIRTPTIPATNIKLPFLGPDIRWRQYFNIQDTELSEIERELRQFEKENDFSSFAMMRNLWIDKKTVYDASAKPDRFIYTNGFKNDNLRDYINRNNRTQTRTHGERTEIFQMSNKQGHISTYNLVFD